MALNCQAIMHKLQGIAVSPGIAIGEALVMDRERFRIPRRMVARDAITHELERLLRGLEATAEEIQKNRDTIARELGPQYGAIFSAHLQMVHDEQLRNEISDLIREHQFSPEYAVSQVLRRYAKVFQALESAQLAERSHDIFDIEKRILRNLLGHRREELSQLTSPVLVLAHNLTPSETANLNRDFVRGFVTEIGGPGSHTAIVAQGLEIPAVVGTGKFLGDVSGGDMVIVDGEHGVVILQPDDATLALYQREVEAKRTYAARLQTLRDLPAETADGVAIELLGNIEFPHEVTQCLERGSDGVGLYRTEFLYLDPSREPTEDVHYQAYAHVLREMAPRPVTIRTLDVGADKITHAPSPEDERNPFLGLRSIRLSLRNTDLFRTQLRAILRASVLGNARIMFPLISTITELRQAKMVLADVMEDLEEGKIPFNRDVEVGMMVEVPAAVTMIDHFVREVDFISIGTNDLIQYTLAVDRSNKDVAPLYNPSDPAVLRLIAQAMRACNEASVSASLCGQMSSDPLFTAWLLGVGLRQLSVVPSAIPEIKRVCRRLELPYCEQVARHVETLDSAREVKKYLLKEQRQSPHADQF